VSCSERVIKRSLKERTSFLKKSSKKLLTIFRRGTWQKPV